MHWGKTGAIIKCEEVIILETINDRIKIIRQIKNLSQTEFGKKVGLSQTTIGQYETNVRKITDRSIIDICRIYGVSELWLKTGRGEMFVKSDLLIFDKIDEIMSGESEFRKNLVKAAVNYTDEEILLLEKIISSLITKKAD